MNGQRASATCAIAWREMIGCARPNCLGYCGDVRSSFSPPAQRYAQYIGAVVYRDRLDRSVFQVAGYRSPGASVARTLINPSSRALWIAIRMTGPKTGASPCLEPWRQDVPQKTNSRPPLPDRRPVPWA